MGVDGTGSLLAPLQDIRGTAGLTGLRFARWLHVPEDTPAPSKMKHCCAAQLTCTARREHHLLILFLFVSRIQNVFRICPVTEAETKRIKRLVKEEEEEEAA